MKPRGSGRVARYRERRREGKAEEREIEALGEKSRDQASRKITAQHQPHQKYLQLQAKNSKRAAAPKKPSRKKPAGRVVARRPVRGRRALRSRGRVHRQRGPGNANLEESGQQSLDETQAQRIPARGPKL